jgi:hypothetical protein
VVDRWANAPTVDFSARRPVVARRLPGDGQPPNLSPASAWPINRRRGNARTDIPRDPRRHSGRWL